MDLLELEEREIPDLELVVGVATEKIFLPAAGDMMVTPKKSDADDKYNIYNSSTFSNPLFIPEIASLLMSYFSTEDLKACRQTCRLWSAVGAKEILCRINKFQLVQVNLDKNKIEAFSSLFASAPQKKKIELSIKLTPYAFCRHSNDLLKLFEIHGQCVTKLTLATSSSSSSEDDPKMYKMAQKLLRNEKFILRNLDHTQEIIQTTAAGVRQTNLELLGQLTGKGLEELNEDQYLLGRVEDGGANKRFTLTTHQFLLKPHLNTLFKAILSTTPNLSSLTISSHKTQYCNGVLEALGDSDVVLESLTNLTINSGRPDWPKTAKLLNGIKARVRLNTLKVAASGKLRLPTIDLCKEIGKSRVTLAYPIAFDDEDEELSNDGGHEQDVINLETLQLVERCTQRAMTMIIHNFETNFAEIDSNGESFVNCVELFVKLGRCDDPLLELVQVLLSAWLNWSFRA